MPDRINRADRLRDYFDVQLQFAERIAEALGKSLEETVPFYTNLHRRFGLGRIRGTPESAEWGRYIQGIAERSSHRERVDWTRKVFLLSREESLPPDDPQFGCFGYSPPTPAGMVRIHFTNRDVEAGIGPLAAKKADRRMGDLKQLFSHLRQTHPSAKEIRGTSWLYHLEAYRRLFPPAYGQSAVILDHGLRFDGTSSWGQLLDHRECIKPEVRDAFLANLERLDLERLSRTFPMPVLRTTAPVEAFYSFYGVPART